MTQRPYTYAEVGATRAEMLPAGYVHLRVRSFVGHEVLDQAEAAVFGWRMYEAAGLQVDGPPAADDAVVRVGLGVGPLRLWAPCRVVWVERSEQRRGFAYGTLAGHPEQGEESFVLDRDDRGDVWLTITSFSRPGMLPTRLAGPLVPLLQRAFARRCGRVLQRLCESAS